MGKGAFAVIPPPRPLFIPLGVLGEGAHPISCLLPGAASQPAPFSPCCPELPGPV